MMRFHNLAISKHCQLNPRDCYRSTFKKVNNCFNQSGVTKKYNMLIGIFIVLWETLDSDRKHHNPQAHAMVVIVVAMKGCCVCTDIYKVPRGVENQVALILSEASAYVTTFELHRGSYMSAHVLLNLLNEMR